MIVWRHANTRLFCCFKSTMLTHQNIKNETLALEINTAYGRYIVDRHVSRRKSLFLQFCKYTKKLLLGNLFVVNRIFFGWLKPGDMQYCHSFIFHDFVLLIEFFWLYQLYYFPILFSVLQCIVLPTLWVVWGFLWEKNQNRAIQRKTLTLE